MGQGNRREHFTFLTVQVIYRDYSGRFNAWSEQFSLFIGNAVQRMYRAFSRTC
jgi:hypothetical protein